MTNLAFPMCYKVNNWKDFKQGVSGFRVLVCPLLLYDLGQVSLPPLVQKKYGNAFIFHVKARLLSDMEY